MEILLYVDDAGIFPRENIQPPAYVTQFFGGAKSLQAQEDLEGGSRAQIQALLQACTPREIPDHGKSGNPRMDTQPVVPPMPYYQRDGLSPLLGLLLLLGCLVHDSTVRIGLGLPALTHTTHT